MINERIDNLKKSVKTYKLSYKNETITYVTNKNFGDSSKKTIFMLHPAFCDHRIFVGQFEEWDSKYNLIAVDMVGHGVNNDLSREITLADMPGIVEGIMHDKNLKEVHLLGVSLGSLVAQGIADRIPNKIASVTIVGGYSIHKSNKEILKAQNKEKGKWLLKILFSMNRFRSYVSQVSTDTKDGQYVFRLGANKFTRRSFMPMQGLQELFRETKDLMVYDLLIVVGENDLPLALDSAKALNEIETKARLIVIESAGHCANIDQSEAFNRMYEDFISGE